jgi:diacylglycerol kinase family enzyme
VCTFQGGSVFHGIRYLWHVMRGSHLRLPDTNLVHCNKLWIEAADSAEVAFQIDGDFGGTLPIEVEVLPEQLKLLVLPDVAQRLGFRT